MSEKWTWETELRIIDKEVEIQEMEMPIDSKIIELMTLKYHKVKRINRTLLVEENMIELSREKDCRDNSLLV